MKLNSSVAPLLLLSVLIALTTTRGGAQQPQTQQQQQQESGGEREEPQSGEPVRVMEYKLTRGVLRQLPLQYEPAEPEPVVLPTPILGGERSAKEEQTKGQQPPQPQPSSPTAEPPHIEQPVKPMHETVPVPPSTEPSRREEQQQQQQLEEHRGWHVHPTHPHPHPHAHADPLVQQLTDEIRHLHHRLHQDHTPFEIEAFEALDRVLRGLRSEAEHADAVLVQVQLFGNFSKELAESPHQLNENLLDAASKLLRVLTESADVSRRPPPRPAAVSAPPKAEQITAEETPKEEVRGDRGRKHAPEAEDEHEDEKRHREAIRQRQQAQRREAESRASQDRRRGVPTRREEEEEEELREREDSDRWESEVSRRRGWHPHPAHPDARLHEPAEDEEMAAFRIMTVVEPIRRGLQKAGAAVAQGWKKFQHAILPLRRAP